MILQLLVISSIVALVYMSGFWDSLDEYINEKFKFYHLPHILECTLCQTFWLSLLYIIITGNLSIITIMLCLVNAHLNVVVIAIFRTVLNFILKIIDSINTLLYL